MQFNSFGYLVFLPLVLSLYWVSPHTLRKLVLLAASYFFYMSWLPVYGLLLLALTVANYGFGLLIASKPEFRKMALAFAVLMNLGVLVYYKYLSFLAQSFLQAAHWLNPSFASPDLSTSSFNFAAIILPLGISFFVFEFVHYLVDVSKGKRAISNFLDFALFAAFFPSQIAGPIKRYEDFCAQLGSKKTFDGSLFYSGLALTVQGLFKKVAIADNLAVIVQQGFSSPLDLGTIDAWTAIVCFALQIYFDFSGYTDMGIGAARMLGFSLPANFNLPYLASSLSDFWRRWHISLSTWLRDYLFIPLGGSRHGRFRTHFNLVMTMLLGGLWHGAAWHYVIWGAFHGFSLVVVHEYARLSSRSKILTKFHAHPIGVGCSILLTFVAVLVGWVFFRADDMPMALQVLERMFCVHGGSDLASDFFRSLGFYAVSIYGCIAALSKASEWYSTKNEQFGIAVQRYVLNQEFRLIYSTAFFLAALAFAPSGSKAFIYFQF